MSARLLLIGSAFLVASCATAQENPNYQHSSKYGQTQVANNSATAPNMTTQASTVATQTAQTDRYSDTHQHMNGQRDAETYSAGAGTAVTHTHVMGSNHDLTSSHAIDVNSAGTPGQATILAVHPQNGSTSPTEQAYNSDTMVGTPGYEMMRAQQNTRENHPSYPTAPAPSYEAAPAPIYTPYTPQAAPAPAGPRQVEYDYGENLRVNENAVPRTMAPNSDQARPGVAVNVLTGQSYTVREGDTVYSLSRRLCAPIGDITTANGIGGDYAIAIGQTLNLPNSRC